MNRETYNAYCASLLATHHVVQWGDADVWKVAGKVFAIGGRSDTGSLTVTFKVSALSYDILKDQPGLRPAPYLASRGMTWIQHFEAPGLNDDDMRAYIAESHRIVAAGLSKKKQREHGLLAEL
ncbi:MAG: MmcQ/YjbR family DNA-binding protein [Pseudomonadota bacterium]